MRWTCSTSSSSSVGRRMFFPRRSAPAKRRPCSASRGGSNVLSVATCAGPARSIGETCTGASSERLSDSISGNSGKHSSVDPLSVAVERGGVVESRHRVHAVKVRDGEVVEAHGDSNLVTFVRSAAKPLQALLLVREYADLADEEIAIACASHGARTEQLDAVKALLARAWATEDELECGPVDGSRLRHNCSGKHAGMLAICAARDWPREGYRLRDHPLQQAVVDEVAGITGVHASELPLAVDGCGVVTFALSLERMAAVFAGFARGEPDGAGRIVSAMT